MKDSDGFKIKVLDVSGEVRRRSMNVASALLVALISVFSIMWCRTCHAMEESHEDIIARKVSSAPIKSKFTPVFVYRSLGGDSGVFAGSGSMYIGSQGEQIVTTEHFFLKELRDQIFVGRKLRPLEAVASHGVEKILHRGRELTGVPGQVPDIIVLKTGGAHPIRCFSDLTLKSTNEHLVFSRIVSPYALTSLISGKRVRVIGSATYDEGRGVTYKVIEYESISGESGSGYVDANDDLYVLKASLREASSPAAEQAVRKLLGSKKAMSLVYGPLHLR